MHYCVAFIQLKPDTPRSVVDEFTAAFRELPNTVDGLCEIHVGPNIRARPGRPDYCLMYAFRDLAAFEEYMPHPEHMRLLDMVKPYFADVPEPEIAVLYEG